MRYHTTTSTVLIAISLLVVAIMAIGVVLGSVDYLHSVSEMLLSKLNQEGRITIAVGSINPSLFKHIVLQNVVIREEHQGQIASVDTLTLEAPLYALFLPKKRPKVWSVKAEGVEGTVDLALFLGLEGQGAMPDFDLDLQFNSVAFKEEESRFSLENGNLRASLRNGLLTKALLNSETFKATTPDLFLTGNGVIVSLSTPQRLTITGREIHFALLDNIAGEANRLELSADGDLLKGSAEVILRGHATSLTTNGTLVEAKSFYGETTIEDFTLKEAKMTTNALHGALGKAEAEIEALNFFYQQRGAHFELTASSEGSLRGFYNQKGVLKIGAPSLVYSSDPELSTLNFEMGNMTLSNLSELDLAPLDALDLRLLEISGFHFFALDNAQTGKTNIESSFSLKGKSGKPLLGEFSGDFAGAVQLEEAGELSFAELAFKNLEATNSYGTMEGLFHYNTATKLLQGTLEHSGNIKSELSYSFWDDELRFSLFLEQTPLKDFAPLFSALIPAFVQSVDENTQLSGNIIGRTTLDGKSGKATSELVLNNVLLNGEYHSLATTFDGNLDSDLLYVNLATLATTDLRLSYSGTFNREQLFPEGRLQLNEVDSGNPLIDATFQRLQTHRYGYELKISALNNTRIEGEISWTEGKQLESRGTLSVPTIIYPLTITGDLEKGVITFESDNLEAYLDLSSEVGHLFVALKADNFTIPIPSFGQSKFSGEIEGSYALANNLLLIEGHNLELNNLAWPNGVPWSIQGNLSLDNQRLRIEEFNYDDPYGLYSGSINLFNRHIAGLFSKQFDEFSLEVRLAGEGGEKLNLVLFPDKQQSDLTLIYGEVEAFSTEHLKLFAEPIVVKATVLGETNFQEIALGYANIAFTDKRESLEGSLTARLSADALTLEEGHFSKGNFHLELPEAYFPFSGTSSIDLSLTVFSDIMWRDANTTSSINLSFALPPKTSLAGWLTSLDKIASAEAPLFIHHYNTSLLGQIEWKEGRHKIEYESGILKVEPLEGGTVSGLFNFKTNEIQVSAKAGFPLPLEMEGSIDASEVSLDVSHIEVDMHYLNAIMYEPTLDFLGGKMAGSLWIEGEVSNPEFFGTLKGNYLEMTTFWTPDEVFSLKNPVITVSEHEATVAASTVSAIHRSGRRSKGFIKLGASLKDWNLEHYRVDIFGLDQPIALWLPIVALNLNVETLVAGNFSIDGTLDDELLLGNVVLTDGVISFGIPPLPSWFVEKTRTSIDMTLQTGKNVSLIYPNFDSPILRATFAENQKVDLKIVAPQMTTTIGGELAFRSGEIYYVQKNFYVTSGALKFSSIMSGLTGDVTPTLDLRARLREFDSDGSRVDIYLVLQDSPLMALEPRFESIPLKSTNEILELLGQNIVTGGSSADSGFSSVVAIASAATDVVSRLGLLQNATISLGFTSIVRNFLGLDVFTIRTNLLANIIFDALPGIIADTSVSPLARYLDNTTMYIGKYLLDELYLQGMLHFRRDPRGSGSSFLSDDLKIETELSLEWTTPLATFSVFTQPGELSVFDIFDTMGFSVTKRFDF